MTENSNISNEDFYFELIAKERSDEISNEEKTMLLEWVNKSNDNREIYEQSSANWKLAVPSISVPEFNTENAWNNLQEKINIDTTSVQSSSRSYGGLFKIAAAVLLIASIVAVQKFLLKTDAETIEFTAFTKNLELYLPDSSKVTLNKNSKLTYTTDYNSKNRKVSLEGEAFFEVRKSTENKFEVYGLRTITTVLGTSFSVKSIKDKPEIVQVVTGKVSVADLNDRFEKNIVLTPGLMAAFDLQSTFNKDSIYNPNFIAWKSRKLTFNNTELKEIIPSLESYFDTRIEVSDPILLSCRFTGSFENPKLQEILEILTISTNSSYQIKTEKTILSGKGCSENHP